MPSGAFYDQTTDGCLSRKNCDLEVPFLAPSFGVFDINLDTNVWDEWMTSEGSTPEGAPSLDREYCGGRYGLTILQEPQKADLKPQRIDTNFNDITNEDAPFEFDDLTAIPELNLETDSLDTPIKLKQGRLYYGYSVLTIAEEQQLQHIAMPYRKASVVSSTSTEEERDSLMLPEPCVRPPGKKRKSSTTDGYRVEASDLCQSKKRGHNAIEKRYRTNLNEKIVLLRKSVPGLKGLPDGEVVDAEEYEKAGVEKHGKAAILTSAVDYITHLEGCTVRFGKETLALAARVAAFEKLAMSGSIQMSGMPSSKPINVETLESIKADFQHSTSVKADKIKAEPKSKARRNTQVSTS